MDKENISDYEYEVPKITNHKNIIDVLSKKPGSSAQEVEAYQCYSD